NTRSPPGTTPMTTTYRRFLGLSIIASAAAVALAAEPARQADSDAFHRKMVAKADEAVAAARPKAEKDPNRPRFHFQAPAPWTNHADGAVQWMATSRDDMLTWDKYPANPVLTGALHKGVVIKDWRDPYAWGDGDRWFMVLGGHRDGGKGCAEIYRSPDLVHWEFLNI